MTCNGRSVDKLILDEIRREIPKDSYGLKEIIWNPIYTQRMNESEEYCLVVDNKKGDCEKGYDCVNASVRAKGVLERHGISSSVYRGRGEDGLFNSKKGGHLFVITDERKEVIDAVPLYPLTGAKHTPVKRLTEENLQKIPDFICLSRHHGKILPPLKLHEEGPCKYLVSFSIKGNYPDWMKNTEYVFMVIHSKYEKMKREHAILAALPRKRKLKTMVENGLEPIRKDYSTDEAVERLELLESKNIIKVERTEPKSHETESERIYLENAKEFVHLVETALLA